MKKLHDGTGVPDDTPTRVDSILGGRVLLTQAEQDADTTAWATAEDEGARVILQKAFKAEALARIAAQVPAWDTLDEVKFLISIANLLNLGAMTAAQTTAKDIYQYYINVVVPKIATLNAAQCAQVDPSAAQPFLAVDAADPGWPTS